VLWKVHDTELVQPSTEYPVEVFANLSRWIRNVFIGFNEVVKDVIVNVS
jgi:hypothetical protein